MGKYRKKPVEIEAFHMTREHRQDNRRWPSWLHEAWQKDVSEEGALYCQIQQPDSELYIFTREGPLHVSWNDWIIRGTKGELYPCKPDIFADIYELAE